MKENAAINMKIVITGGSGLVGRSLTKMLLEAGCEVVILTRNPEAQKSKFPLNEKLSYAKWDIASQFIDQNAIRDARAIIHLAGAGVMEKPWTAAYKKELMDSRVESAKLILKALREVPNTVETVVSASAIGWYRASDGGNALEETEPVASGFLGDICSAWEAAIKPVEALGKKLVILRLGIVLDRDGGALAEFKKSLRLRVASVLGSGRQMISWIHIEDLCRMMIFALQHPEIRGVYNAVAPLPVTNKALNLSLGKAMYGKGFLAIQVPAFILKFMLGERSIEILKSARISSKKIEQSGFVFKYPDIDIALRSLV